MTTRITYGLEDELRFGRYKGEMMWIVIRDFPDYVEWCMENLGLQLDNECYEYLQDVKRAQR